MIDPEEYEDPLAEKETTETKAPLAHDSGDDDKSDDLVGREIEETAPSSSWATTIWEYSMYAIAGVLFVFGLMIWQYSLATVLSNQRIPSILDAPCFFTFLLLGVIFLALGFSVRELEIEEAEESEKETGKASTTGDSPPVSHLPIHDDISLRDLDFENEREKRVFEKLLTKEEPGNTHRKRV